MNVLKNYKFKLGEFSFSDMSKMLNHSSEKYKIKKLGLKYYIENIHTGKIEPLKCISNYYTDLPNSKSVKIAKNNSQCYNTRKHFDTLNVCENGECIICHDCMLDKFLEEKITILRK